MNKPKIVVFAYSDLGHACLKFLLERGENVVGVYTHEDHPGENVWFPSVFKLANEHSILVQTDENLNTEKEVNHFQSLSPDIIFSFYYRHLIPSVLLNIPRLGAYNMHGSFLPKYRGRAPVNWAVLNGETTTGATLHVMIEKPDAGDIVDQETVDIGPEDTTAIVQARVTKAAVAVLARQIENLKAGTAPRIPQDHSQASTFGKRQAKDGEINWSWPAARIHNLVRAVSHPYPGAFGELLGEKIFVWKTRLTAENSGNHKPGSLDAKKSRLLVACGDGHFLEVLELQRENEKETSGIDFVRRHLTTKENKV